METRFHLEIFLVVGTGLTKRECFKNVPMEDDLFAFGLDQLEAACWNGLLYELLPELMGNAGKINVWEIHQSNCALLIELADVPPGIETILSIFPNFFIPGKGYQETAFFPQWEYSYARWETLRAASFIERISSN